MEYMQELMIVLAALLFISVAINALRPPPQPTVIYLTQSEPPRGEHGCAMLLLIALVVLLALGLAPLS